MSESMSIDYSSLSELESEARNFIEASKSEKATSLDKVKKICDVVTYGNIEARKGLYELELRQLIRAKNIGQKTNQNTRRSER